MLQPSTLKKIYIGLAAVAGFGMGLIFFVGPADSLEAVPYVPPTEQNSKSFEVDDQFYIIVADELVEQRSGITRDMAGEACEAEAYNTDNMWKQVICVFEDEEIYNDIFVAG